MIKTFYWSKNVKLKKAYLYVTHIGRESVKKLDWVLPFSSELPSSPKRGFGGITPRPPREILKIYFKSGISGHVAAMLYFNTAVGCFTL